jgi:CheY-like chemotaxis protein
VERSPKPVLIVDDDPGVRGLLVDLLEDEGYQVASAANGEEALALLRSGTARPCVILLDLMMPVMNGWQFRGEQQSDPALASIPTLVLSAGENLARTATTLDAQAFFSKPIDLDALLQTVAAFCSAP